MQGSSLGAPLGTRAETASGTVKLAPSLLKPDLDQRAAAAQKQPCWLRAWPVHRIVGMRRGDALILGKPIGGAHLLGRDQEAHSAPGGYRKMIATATLLNRFGGHLVRDRDLHAITRRQFGFLLHS